MASYKDIDATELHAMLEQGGIMLVDVRNDDEVARGVINGATHIPLNMLPIRLSELPDDIPLVFYCHSGIRSAHACAFLANHGHEDLYNLQGGVIAWGRAGYPFVTKS